MTPEQIQRRYIDKWLKGGDVLEAKFVMDHGKLAIYVTAKNPETVRLPGVDNRGTLEGIDVILVVGDMHFPPNEVTNV